MQWYEGCGTHARTYLFARWQLVSDTVRFFASFVTALRRFLDANSTSAQPFTIPLELAPGTRS